MEILNELKYNQHYSHRKNERGSLNYEFLFTILLFGSIGAITWAIRGTAGWGGVDGTVIPGITWGILWYYLAYRKGIDARGIVLWLGLGIALGGELGYGQYTGWILGNFSVGDKIIPIKPGLGYFWFTICGIGWAASGGIILGWALGKNRSVKIWLVRSLILIPLLILLFASPVIDWLGVQLLKTNSGILFPNIEMGIYNELDEHLSRTIYTNTQNFAVVVWWIIALLVAILQRDKTTVIAGLIIGGGFGIGFMQSAIWTLGYGIAPHYIDWWKIWELNSGFNLGILYAITLYWAIRHFDKTHISESALSGDSVKLIKSGKWRETLFIAVAGFVLLYFVGFEYFFWTGLALSLFYFITMSLTPIGISDMQLLLERRKNISLTYSIFLLVFMMFHGGSERFGIVFKLYGLNEVEQYSWPLNRILIFVPFALIITSVAVLKMWKILHNPSVDKLNTDASGLSMRMIDLMTLIAFIGVLSIWPSEICVFYAFFLAIAIFAFNRLNHHLNGIDNKLPLN